MRGALAGSSCWATSSTVWLRSSPPASSPATTPNQINTETHTASTMKKLEGLTYTPAWISHMGCLSGCTRHLDILAQTAVSRDKKIRE